MVLKVTIVNAVNLTSEDLIVTVANRVTTVTMTTASSGVEVRIRRLSEYNYRK